jgi:hypothetical protein
MRIVGVGQMFNFQTGEVEDRIQIISSIGTQFSVPTTNEGAALLVKMAMAARNYPTDDEVDIAESVGKIPDSSISDDEDLSGVSVFGGSDSSTEDWDDGGDDDLGSGHTQMFSQTKPKSPSLGRTSNPPDRSGVPSYGISRVDERGNPILPEAPAGIAFEDDDEEDDPGESI